MAVKDLNMRECFALNQKEADETGQEEEEHSSAGSSPSQARMNLGITILASRFSANTRRGAHRIKYEMPKLRKPKEPDFSTEPYE
jgi:cyclic nucleotide gated channel